jgi:hypothetical protein
MKTFVEFNFLGWTKGSLIEFCYGKNAQVDTAIPQDCVKSLQEFHNDPHAQFWYVMDYTPKNPMGRLVNLKEKFFDVVRDKALSDYCKENYINISEYLEQV